MGDNKSKSRNIIFLIIFAIIFIAAFIFLYSIYKGEGEKRSAFIDTQSGKPDYIEIIANIVTIDPIRGDMTVRLNFEPRGKLANEKGCLTEDIELYVNNSSGKQEYNFLKNKFINPVEVTISLFDGLVTDYPLDKHKAELIISTSKMEKKDGSTSEIEESGVDNVLNFSGSVVGYKILAEQEQENENSYIILDIQVERSDSVKIFSFFVIATMWLLIIVLLRLLYTVSFNGRKIEVNMFTFSSAMLFAFPAFRNIMPFAPPIGALPDYIAFFWAESTAAFTLSALILIWSIRKQ